MSYVLSGTFSTIMSETRGSTEEGSIFSSLYESDRRETRLPTVSFEISALSAISTTFGGLASAEPSDMGQILTIFALRVHFDQDLFGAHDLDDFSDIGTRL